MSDNQDHRARRRTVCAALWGLCLTLTPPVLAQDVTTGGVPKSAVGEVGQRQTVNQPEQTINTRLPIDRRIRNRVESRIRNRIDRFYDPQANATSPFRVANDQVSTVGTSSR